MTATMHPMGPKIPSICEPDARHGKRVMPYKPKLNALGPPIASWWVKELHKINDRFVLQFSPSGIVQGAYGVRGFWSVCIRLPRSGMLYKQHVMSLIGEDGKFLHPTVEDLMAIKKGWYEYMHMGFNAIYDDIDRNSEQEEQAYEEDCYDKTVEMVDDQLRKENPELGFTSLKKTRQKRRVKGWGRRVFYN